MVGRIPTLLRMQFAVVLFIFKLSASNTANSGLAKRLVQVLAAQQFDAYEV